MNENILIILQCQNEVDRIDGVIVSVLTSSEVNRGFELLSSQTNDYKIDICCFSAKHAALWR
jgi:hypothetical protein